MDRVSAVLFDMDGTLFNTEVLKASALAQSVVKLGGVSSPAIYKDVMGSSWRVVCNHFLGAAQIFVQQEEFDSLFRSIYLPLIQKESEPRPGAREYIVSLHKKNVRVGLVSSASRWMVNEVVSRSSFENLFDLCIAGDDVERHKPDPEAYMLALSKLRLSANETYVFEDSGAGVEAGVRAGCHVVAIRHEFNSEHDFSRARRTISSFEELLEGGLF